MGPPLGRFFAKLPRKHNIAASCYAQRLNPYNSNNGVVHQSRISSPYVVYIVDRKARHARGTGLPHGTDYLQLLIILLMLVILGSITLAVHCTKQTIQPIIIFQSHRT